MRDSLVGSEQLQVRFVELTGVVIVNSFVRVDIAMEAE